MNKHEAVKKHLQNKKTITSWEAIELYGATRLSAIIFNLKKSGMPITTKQVAFTDRFGNKGICTQYELSNE